MGAFAADLPLQQQTSRTDAGSSTSRSLQLLVAQLHLNQQRTVARIVAKASEEPVRSNDGQLRFPVPESPIQPFKGGVLVRPQRIGFGNGVGLDRGVLGLHL